MMKESTKKLLAMLLGCALMISLFAACGSSTPAPASNAPADSAPVESAAEPEAETEAEPAETPEAIEAVEPAAEEPETIEAVSAEEGTDDLVNNFLESEPEPADAAAELEYNPDGKVVPGTYTFDDYKADMDFSIIWTLTLNEDGSYTLAEDNPFIGVQEYAGGTSETDGNRLICGAMDPDKATKEGDWAYPTGFSVLVDADAMTFMPEEISDEVFGREENEDGEPAGGPGGPQDGGEG